jgi:metal-sulfur cluster biosynthetic enzyme
VSPSFSDDLMRRGVLEALRDVIDPEVGLNIVDLGLVYEITRSGDDVTVTMTMTTPACPLGEQIVRDAQARLATIDGLGAVSVDLVWEPAWTPDRMSATAKEALGWSR